MQIGGILETCLYAPDLAEAERFYTDVLGLAMISHEPGRHIFFRCGQGVLLLFNSERTSTDQTTVGGAIIPLHGTTGAGHVAFRVEEQELDAWRERLRGSGVTIESVVTWPGGGRSIYFRDPAGNSLEFAMASIWGV
jgi:catechol 2,3-dioxygenase-like lactoylglutathione lyase family enzyme